MQSPIISRPILQLLIIILLFGLMVLGIMLYYNYEVKQLEHNSTVKNPLACFNQSIIFITTKTN